MTDTNVLVCDKVGKYFADGETRVDVLQEINLTVKAQDRVAIIGDSGSGKSTLLHIMGGLDRPTHGKVLIEDKDIAQMNERDKSQLRNFKLGFVYQFHHLLPEFSALENVAIPLIIRKDLPMIQLEEQAAKMLEAVGLGHRLSHKPSKLSGGERQRAAIARALVTNPKAVLADEPTGNLDRRTAGKVFDLMLKLNDQLGTSLVIVTHDEKIAQKMDRVYVLEDGKLK